MPPTLVYMLMSLPNATRADFPQLKRLIYGGAPMPPEKIREVRAFFGPALGTPYGLNDAMQSLTVMKSEYFDDERNGAAVGRRSWFRDVSVMSPDGKMVPTEDEGVEGDRER